MHTFNDAAGRVWTIALHLGAARAVKDKLGVDLLAPEAGEPPLLTRLAADELLLGEVICAMLQEQFDAHHVSADDVRRAFDGATLLAAQQAFYAELEDFFRRRGRPDRARAVQAQARWLAKAAAAMEQKLADLDLDAMLDGALSGNGLASSASTPCH